MAEGFFFILLDIDLGSRVPSADREICRLSKEFRVLRIGETQKLIPMGNGDLHVISGLKEYFLVLHC